MESSIWTIAIPKDTLFSTTVKRVNYLYSKQERKPDQPINEKQLLSEEERELFDDFLDSAIGKLKTLLASKVNGFDGTFVVSDENITISMLVNGNHNDYSRDSLAESVKQFLINRCTELLSGLPQGESLVNEDEIKHILQIRKRSISNFRKCHPMF